MKIEELKKLEKDLWDIADSFRANTGLKSSEYAIPILGLIFLKFTDNRYSRFEKEINDEFKTLKGSRREKTIDEIAVEKSGFYLPEKARYEYLLNLAEDADLAQAIKDAMSSIEKYKPELKGVLPQQEYFALDEKKALNVLSKLIKNFADIPKDADGDILGQIYEYFLGKFALSEGQNGGEFFTPKSVVRLMVEMIEPHNGTVFDPACGSGGMFVQSAKFVEQRNREIKNSNDMDLFVYGQEKNIETVKLAKMNLAVNGLRGNITQAISYYDDPFKSFEKFDYVLANPPFNVDDVNLAEVEGDKRFNLYGVPRNKTKTKKKGNEKVPNANYLWINLFATSLKPTGRAGLVMANSASDARSSEAEIRKKLIENNIIYSMITLPSNMFYTVTLPATLWFFDRAKADDKILFIDARNIFKQIDRAHREFTEEHIQNIVMISHLHKGECKLFIDLINSYFKSGFDNLVGHKDNLESIIKEVDSLLEANGVQGDDLSSLSIIQDIESLHQKYKSYKDSYKSNDVEFSNDLQRNLANEIEPFFIKLHSLLKHVSRDIRDLQKDNKSKDIKAVKSRVEILQQEIKDVEYFFSQILWLQERFPDAKYEDVTGLCKLADFKEVKEQDYSLNPGRYVGVVIEDDGKTEEEFIDELFNLNQNFQALSKEASCLESIINSNITELIR